MTLKNLILVGLALLPTSLLAADAFYCPEFHQYINAGMTQAEVIGACGQPIAKEVPNKPVTEKVPVQQLVYNNQGTRTAFYGVWNIPIGSGGATLEVDIIENKVSSMRVNGTNQNSISICGSNIPLGAPVGAVYNACGNPSIVNNTFINKIVPGNNKAEVWTYQPDQYQPPIRLTFINGKLQSID